MQELDINEAIEVEFIYTTAYLSNFKFKEYIIHQIKLKVLHHQPIDKTVEEVKVKLKQYLQLSSLQTLEQIRNTIRPICSLAG